RLVLVEVGRDALLEVAGLAHVEHNLVLADHAIDAGSVGQPPQERLEILLRRRFGCAVSCRHDQRGMPLPVMPMPGWMAAMRRARCRLRGGRSRASSSSARSGRLHTSTMSQPDFNAAAARAVMPPATVAASMVRSSEKTSPSKP